SEIPTTRPAVERNRCIMSNRKRWDVEGRPGSILTQNRAASHSRRGANSPLPPGAKCRIMPHASMHFSADPLRKEPLGMSILVVGTVAIDSIETPTQARDRVLGGSATHFSYAASFFSPVRLVGVVGDDFPSEHLDVLRTRQIDLEGLEVVQGG